MLKAARCYRLTLVLNDSTSTGNSAPVQLFACDIRQNVCYTEQITSELATLLLVRALHVPSVIWKHIDTLLKYELVTIRTEEYEPHLFSLDELSETGIPLDFIQPCTSGREWGKGIPLGVQSCSPVRRDRPVKSRADTEAK
jgi:hypothetical protein